MKRITYAFCLMLCLLSGTAPLHAQPAQTAQTHPQQAAPQTAQPAAAPDYAAQLQALREQSLAQEERKNEINSTEVEQLHQRYSVDELRLENQRTRQYLLRRSLQGVALLATPGVDGPTQRACNEMIGQNSELLRKLMNDVIAFSCTNPQQMLFSLQPTDVVQLCQLMMVQMGGSYAGSAGSDSIELQFPLPTTTNEITSETTNPTNKKPQT